MAKARTEPGLVVAVNSKAFDRYFLGLVVTYEYWAKGMKVESPGLNESQWKDLRRMYDEGRLLPVVVFGTRICRKKETPDGMMEVDEVRRFAFVDTSKMEVEYYDDLEALTKVLHMVKWADYSQLAHYILVAVREISDLKHYLQNPDLFQNEFICEFIFKAFCDGVPIKSEVA